VQHPDIVPDLSRADLGGANVSRANLFGANLRGATLTDANLGRARLLQADLSVANASGANFSGANLVEADLQGANLRDTTFQDANLSRADLESADLSRADLRKAYLGGADLTEAKLSNADLTHTNLSRTNLSKSDLGAATLEHVVLERAILVDTNLSNARLRDCHIYGISSWNLNLEGTEQTNLTITQENEPAITVDNLEVAQFIYLMINNESIRRVIDTITSKAVLILGRFTLERKSVLDRLREAVRSHGYLPILFDFEKPASRDLTETISTLAHLARFIIADLTDAKSIPQELERIVPDLPSVPVQPLLASSDREYAMFEHFTRYPWVLPIYRYEDQDALLASLEAKVIMPAMAKANELAPPSR
jgi:uncharacterized protein YjbI with pentapeptide repeats